MRPLELSLKGLHSFREKQTVHFTDLIREGIFGIFGPTGSGKSSILDAMTLALYGSVERAPNNTNGIINQAENDLFVSFTFQLGSGDHKTVLKVERTYKRSGSHHVKTAGARLHDLTGSPTVLADKTSDVNKKVEQTLGLSIHDFTRAVVLPQGKFSEFLTLKGNERRLMLQRIFQLEKYGDQLIKKVKTGLQDAVHARERIESEQQGLGSDPAAFKRAGHEKAYWENRLQEVLTDRKHIEEKWQRMKQHRQWEQEWKESVQKRNELLAQQGVMEEQRRQLERSATAEILLPYAESMLEAQTEEQKWQEEEEKARLRLDNARTHYNKTAHDMEAFTSEKQQAEQEIRRRENDADKADEYHSEMVQSKHEQKNLEQKKNEIERRIGEQTAEEETMQKNLEKYEQAVEDFQVEMEHLQQSMEDPYALMQAKEEKQSIRQLQQQYDQLQDEKKAENSRELTFSSRLKDYKRDRLKRQEHLEERFRQLLYWYNKCSDELPWLEQIIHQLQQWSDNCRDEAEQIKQHAAAAGLAARLIEDSACPVCGSIHHPSPAKKEKTEQDAVNIMERKDRLDEWVQRLQQAKMQFRQRQWLLQQLSDQMTGMIPRPVNPSEEPLKHKADWFLPTVHENKEWEKALEKKLNEWETEGGTIDFLQQDIEREKQNMDRLSMERNELFHQWKTASNGLQEKVDRTAELLEQLHAKKKEWQKTYPRFSYETIEEQQRERMKQDDRKQTLQKRMEDGTSYIRKLQQDIQEKKNERHSTMVEHKEIETKLKQVADYVREREKQIQTLLNDEASRDLRSRLERHKKEWSDKEQHMMSEMEKAATEKQEAENAHSVASHALNEAQKRNKSTARKWKEQTVKYTDMPNEPDEVKQYLLSDHDKTEKESMIKHHDHSLHYWQKAKEDLEPKIPARPISEDEWGRMESTRNSVLELVDYTREKWAAALETMKSLEQKKDRYQALENERLEWHSEAEKYRRLDQVFRGRGFIDFLAEEQLQQVTRTASEWLRELTRGRYAVEIDDEGGFIIRDESNAGLKRPVSSLSGGETFLTSLALALALSASIQLKGRYPLEFFFLDEGFGTLDQELLDTVMTALEKLQMNNLAVGIISHVPDIQERLLHKLIVKEAEPGGKGSSIEQG
ncbi:AAA family ATPase [Salibacterium sp. K-3]